MKVVDVGRKLRTRRVAVARGRLSCTAATLDAIERGEIEKGDVVSAARLAGILGAKRTPDLVPLCHPVALSGIEVEVKLARRPSPAILVTARVRSFDRTGVEMEAMAAVCTAALCAYDMLKSRERGMILSEVALIRKAGGRTGAWSRTEG